VKWLWLTQLAATLYMTGVIWLVQIVHYPLFALVGRDGFALYEARHTSWITWVVAPAMVVELATALALLAARPTGVPPAALWLGVGLLAVIWLSTLVLQVPAHTVLAEGFDAVAHRRLVATNWIRTLAWTARSALLLVLTARLLSAGVGDG
jgi:hypothetical protein